MANSPAVGVKSMERVEDLQQLLTTGAHRPSQREAVSTAIDWAATVLEKGLLVYDAAQLQKMMREKTIRAAAANTQAALQAFDKTATYSVVADAETGNSEITRKAEDETRTIILIERSDVAAETARLGAPMGA